MLRNNGMYKEEKTTNNIGYAMVNPEVEYIGKNATQNDDKKRNRQLCLISQSLHAIIPLCQIRIYFSSFSFFLFLASEIHEPATTRIPSVKNNHPIVVSKYQAQWPTIAPPIPAQITGNLFFI